MVMVTAHFPFFLGIQLDFISQSHVVILEMFNNQYGTSTDQPEQIQQPVTTVASHKQPGWHDLNVRPAESHSLTGQGVGGEHRETKNSIASYVTEAFEECFII